jgi:phosphatidylglycerol:prolipoprotein diacylglycerol transferase
MSAVWAVPFVHPTTVLVGLGVAVALAWTLPLGRSRLLWAGLGGVVAGAAVVLAGVLPLWGTLHIAAYGVMMGLAAWAAWWIITRRSHHLGLDHRTIADVVVVCLVSGIIGARIRHVWERWDQEFAPLPLATALERALDLDRGGAVWYGGMIAAILAFAVLVRIRRLPMLALLDLTGPALLAAIAIGRIGCFLNGCCYGAPTDLPWGVACPVPPYVLVHPAPLYESAACALMAVGLWWLWGRRHSDGQVIAVAICGYAVWRFANEFLRGDLDIPRTYLGLTPAQATSLHLIVAVLLAWALESWLRRRDPRRAVQARLVPGSRHAAQPHG